MEEKKRPYTEAQKQAAKKWDSQNLERITAAVPAGTLERIRTAAPGVSASTFSKNAILAALQAAEAQAQARMDKD